MRQDGDHPDNDSDRQLTELTVETLRLEAGVSMEEAAVLLAKSNMSALSARLAEARAKAVELGVVRPKLLGRDAMGDAPDDGGTSDAHGPIMQALPSSTQDPDGLADDAFIDQRDERVPNRRIYLRLAREGAFPSRKVGKRIIARWGDVKAALTPDRPNTKPSPQGARPKNQDAPDDGLDDLRRSVGLDTKGGK